jgi:hypothetical protein
MTRTPLIEIACAAVFLLGSTAVAISIAIVRAGGW